MKAIIIGFFVWIGILPDPQIDEAIYAGRYATNTETVKYNTSGVPINKTWLTADEWQGKHIESFLLTKKDKRIVKRKFKKWKKEHINNFLNDMVAAAVEESQVYTDIPPEIIVAQSVLESNFGLSELCYESNNYFGHKYFGIDSSGFVIAHDDSPEDKFKVFKSKWWSIRSHSKLLTRKYRHRIKGKPTIRKWCNAFCGGLTLAQSKLFVKNGGYTYATSCYKNSQDKNICYGQKLLSLINCYKLKQRCEKYKRRLNKN
jgi:flagellum-specific peptidoglycan hydrolase FlgJ